MRQGALALLLLAILGATKSSSGSTFADLSKKAMAAPTDPTFYAAVVPMAQRLGTKAEDLLWVWASETGFDPTQAGDARTISTLMHGVVPDLLTEAEWASLPTLSAAAQLPFIERYYKLLHDRYLGGRGFQDTFELYLANAAPGLLRRDGQYNPISVMYGNPASPMNYQWAPNFPMDNYPAAVQQSKARDPYGAGLELTTAFGKQLVSEGYLKGWITLNDLKNFMMRSDVAAVANDAINRLHGSQVTTAAFTQSTTTPATYTPNADKSFGNPAAPIDTRVAPASTPKRSLFSLPDVMLVSFAVYVAFRWMKR